MQHSHSFNSQFSKIFKIVLSASFMLCLPVASHALVEDYGVASIDSPSGSGKFGATETLTVKIQNFGTAPTTSLKPVNLPLDVEIKHNGKVISSYQSVVNDTTVISAGSSITVSLPETIDLSSSGTYLITVATTLPADADASNDSATATITIIKPSPTADKQPKKQPQE